MTIMPQAQEEGFPDLVDLKRWALNVRERLLNILGSLTIEEINNLKSHYEDPKFFAVFTKNFFPLAKIYSEVQQAGGYERLSDRRLFAIGKKLCKLKEDKKALEIVEKIQSDERRKIFLLEIGKAYIKSGQLSKAERIAMTVCDGWGQESLLSAIGEAYIKSGQLSEAERIAMTVCEEWRKESLWLEIGKAYIKSGQLSEAERIAIEELEGYLQQDLIKKKIFQEKMLAELL